MHQRKAAAAALQGTGDSFDGDISARLLAVSRRSLQRLFNEYVGVGPKWVINRYRLHEAIERLAGDAAVNWTELALELGYFDQAHFIRDFKALVGQSPAAYMRKEIKGG